MSDVPDAAGDAPDTAGDTSDAEDAPDVAGDASDAEDAPDVAGDASDADDASAGDHVDESLLARARALLEPGEIDLVGVVVPMDVPENDEPQLHQNTIEVGDVIASHAGVDPADTYVYSGNDDPEFGVNQHQGLTVEGDEFVWECQQLYREGRYVVVFYYEAETDQDGILADLDDAGYEAVGVEA